MPENGDSRECGSRSFVETSHGGTQCAVCGCRRNFRPDRCDTTLTFKQHFDCPWMAYSGTGASDREINGVCIEGWYWGADLVITLFRQGMSYAAYKRRWPEG